MFKIATNIDPLQDSIKRHVDDYILDTLPDSATDEDAAIAFAYHIIGSMKAPRTMDTVRKHYLARWAFLRELAEILPDHFDEVQAAYAERALAFEQPELAA